MEIHLPFKIFGWNSLDSKLSELINYLSFFVQAFPLQVNYLYLGNNGLTSLASDLVDWTSVEDFQFAGML